MKNKIMDSWKRAPITGEPASPDKTQSDSGTLFLYFITGFIGYGILLYFASWQITVAIFILNMRQHFDFNKNPNDKTH